MSFDSAKLMLFLLLVTLTLLGCKKVDSLQDCEEHTLSACTTDPNLPNIRIKNTSTYSLCNVELDPGSGSLYYGILDPGEVTCYRAVPQAYLASYIHFMVGDSELVQQPFDHMPTDSTLDPGNFTLEIDVTALQTYGGIQATYLKD